MKNIFLFDMDGTLTPPRKPMGWDISAMLTDIQRSGDEIGIITGSDMDYVKQQCSLIFDMSPVNAYELHFLPCNGTKYYHNDRCVYEQDMKDVFTPLEWNSLIRDLLICQTNFVLAHNIPLSSHFISFRGSMINWCPIGRTATHEQREQFVKYDKENNVREMFLEHLINNFIHNEYDLTIKLGGDTSFDIYPTGWDKTFPLESTDYFNDYQIYFVGDRCSAGGNDREIFLHPRTTAKETSSPEHTIEIVKSFRNLMLVNNE